MYPDFNELSDIHTYASNHQLGAVIIQNVKPIAFYRLKLTGPQTQYTVMGKELISKVQTFKKFRTILLGQQLKTYTNYKYIKGKNFNTDRVLRRIHIL